MKHVSIKEAKDRLPALVRAAEAGERVVITRNGRPVADVVAHERNVGLDWAGFRKWREEAGLPELVGEIPINFDDPLPEDFLLRPLP
ncbi:MAG: type II toxin-antitoxin system Phd/YefM family antitoxin [Allosphingosinicella sp.]